MSLLVSAGFSPRALRRITGGDPGLIDFLAGTGRSPQGDQLVVSIAATYPGHDFPGSRRLMSVLRDKDP